MEQVSMTQQDINMETMIDITDIDVLEVCYLSLVDSRVGNKSEADLDWR